MDKSAIEEYYLGMIDRMNSDFVDYSYQHPDKKRQLQEGELQVNFNAVCYVLRAATKVYEIAFNQGCEILEGKL